MQQPRKTPRTAAKKAAPAPNPHLAAAEKVIAQTLAAGGRIDLGKVDFDTNRVLAAARSAATARTTNYYGSTLTAAGTTTATSPTSKTTCPCSSNAARCPSPAASHVPTLPSRPTRPTKTGIWSPKTRSRAPRDSCKGSSPRLSGAATKSKPGSTDSCTGPSSASHSATVTSTSPSTSSPTASPSPRRRQRRRTSGLLPALHEEGPPVAGVRQYNFVPTGQLSITIVVIGTNRDGRPVTFFRLGKVNLGRAARRRSVGSRGPGAGRCPVGVQGPSYRAREATPLGESDERGEGPPGCLRASQGPRPAGRRLDTNEGPPRLTSRRWQRRWTRCRQATTAIRLQRG